MKLTGACISMLLGTSTVVASISAFPSEAHAWFEVCNRSSKPVTTAFAYLDITALSPDIFGNSPPQARGSWHSKGWYSLRSGQCAQTYPHQLNLRNKYYYVYAESEDGRWVWGGNNSFCTLSTKLSTIFDLPLANQRCQTLGTWKSFIELNTGNSKNFTFNLNN